MTFSLSILNSKYRNLSEISHSENAWRIIRVNDPKSQQAYQALLRCWTSRFLSADHFEELRSDLRDAYVALRSTVGSAEAVNSHCDRILQNLRKSIQGADNFLSPDERKLLSDAALKFEDYSKAQSYPLSEAVIFEMTNGPHEKSLVVSSPSQRTTAETIVGDNMLHGSIPRLLASTNFQARNHVVLVAAPDPQRIPIEHLRRLFLGGEIVKATFIVPNWWLPGVSKLLNAALWFGLPVSQPIKIVETGLLAPALVDETEKVISNWDLSVPPRPMSRELERFAGSGPVECQLLGLEHGLVMPVEKSAKRLSVIRKSALDGSFVLESVSPRQASESQEIVFSFAQVSEREFIREQAEILLGDSLSQILEIQGIWKKQLREHALKLGWSELETQLSDLGVKKAHRVRWWMMDPNFIRPMADKDFSLLLRFLNLDEEFANQAFLATRRINHARDSAGKVARKALLEALSEQAWSTLQSGHPCEINLANVGEASFVACRSTSLSESTVMANVLQVRRILGGA